MATAFDLAYYEIELDELGAQNNGDGSPRSPMSPKIQEKEADESLTPLQARFRQCIEMGVVVPQSSTGCYACEPDDYDLFWPFFSF